MNNNHLYLHSYVVRILFCMVLHELDVGIFEFVEQIVDLCYFRTFTSVYAKIFSILV